MKKIFRTVAFVLALGSLSAGFTACGDDETKDALEDLVSVDEVIDVANFKIKANADGTITFVGDVSSNAKIKTFVLQDQSGKTVYDFVASNDQVKEKLKDIAEDGTVTKEKVFSLKNITSSNIPVDLYTLVIKTKKANTEAALGEVLDYLIGASGSKTGSYLSIVNNDAFDQTAAETEKNAEVIAVSSSDGYTVEGLKRASEAKSDKVVARAGKVALFDATGASATQINKGGVIITESGCICKINELTNTSTGDATVKAVTIKKNDKLGITVDVSGYTFSK
jgi:ABC-type transport system substrate-binding protein